MSTFPNQQDTRVPYFQSTDPGAVGNGVWWFDTQYQRMRVRNSANDGWLDVTNADTQLVIPAVADFSWVNQGGSSAQDTVNGLSVRCPTDTSTNMRCLVASAPSTPWTVTAKIFFSVGLGGSPISGVMFRDSASGKIVRFGIYSTGTVLRVQIAKMDSATTFNSNYLDQEFNAASLNPMWLRITDNGTNRISALSATGEDDSFVDIHSIGRTDFLTANQYGVFCDVNNGTYEAVFTVPSLVLT